MKPLSRKIKEAEKNMDYTRAMQIAHHDSYVINIRKKLYDAMKAQNKGLVAINRSILAAMDDFHRANLTISRRRMLGLVAHAKHYGVKVELVTLDNHPVHCQQWLARLYNADGTLAEQHPFQLEGDFAMFVNLWVAFRRLYGYEDAK